MTAPSQPYPQRIHGPKASIPMLAMGLLRSGEDVVLVLQHGWHRIALAQALGQPSIIGHRSSRFRTLVNMKRRLRTGWNFVQNVSGRLPSVEALGQLDGHDCGCFDPGLGHLERNWQRKSASLSASRSHLGFCQSSGGGLSLLGT